MRFLVIFPVLIVASASFALKGKAENGSFEGVVTIAQTRGGLTTQTLYTRKGNDLRIENIDKSKPEPINIVDLATKKLTIVYPHNSSFVVVDLARTPSVAGVGDPGGRVPGASMPVGPGSTSPATVGPAISPPPGFPTPPPMPSMPPRPNDPMALGVPPMPGGMPGLPPMPPIAGFRGALELKKTDRTTKIQGFACMLYTLSDGRETFEIWATPDAALFPFRLVRTNYRSRHFGPVMLEEQWIELLRNQSLFPLEATLRADLPAAPASPPRNGQQTSVSGADHSQERYSFKVDKIEKKKIDNPEELFSPPKDYYEIAGQ